MSTETVHFHLVRGNVGQFAHYIRESALILGKPGAARFGEAFEEADYFMWAITYHGVVVEQSYQIVLHNDELRAADLEPDGFYAEGRRGDLMAVVYNFGALLVSVRSFFDRLVRILRTPISQNLPNSINGLNKTLGKAPNNKILSDVLSAWNDWGQKAADYRDCLLHYSTIDAGSHGIFTKTSKRELLIPDNPRDRSRKLLSFDSKIELASYARELEDKSEALFQSTLEAIFELLITEEFGEKCKWTYWDETPQIDIRDIGGNHELPFTPGVAVDADGDSVRVPRRLALEDGRTIIHESLPDDWAKSAKYPIESTNPEPEASLVEMKALLSELSRRQEGKT